LLAINREYDRQLKLAFLQAISRPVAKSGDAPTFGFDPDPPPGWSQRQVQGEEILRNRLPMMEATGEFVHVENTVGSPVGLQ
jgi:hypothetical protein